MIMARFTLPRDIYHGKGALEELKNFKGKKAVICVGGGTMKRLGFLDRAEAYLKEARMEVTIIDGIEPDPSVATVMKGAAVMQEFQPDWIVAIGGGSPIDAAKAMWIKYEHPDCTFEDMCKVFGIPELRNKAHFCAVSSTSGTATEVTAFSVITDYSKGIKYPLADFEINPDAAIVDPDLAEPMPKRLTAQCRARMAFSYAPLGIVHSMAHKTGAAFADYGAHIIHGAANAMYLPKVIAFNAKDKTAKARYGVIVDYMGIADVNASDDEKVAALIAHLRDMCEQLNIPHCIKNYGADSYPTENGFVPEDVFLARLHDIAVNAVADACTGSNPRQPSVEEMEKLLKCCYYDTEVDF